MSVASCAAVKAKTSTKKMPLVTLDPNMPKLFESNGVSASSTEAASPHKRSVTPPHSPPTPHKIELVEDSADAEVHRRRLRSSQSVSADNAPNADAQLTVANASVAGAAGRKSVVAVLSPNKKKIFQQLSQNGTSKLRSSPRKTEFANKNGVANGHPAPPANGVSAAKGPKKKLSFVDTNDKSAGNTVKAYMPIRRSERRPKKNQTTETFIQKLKEVGDDESVLPLSVVDIPGKNRGVVPTKKILQGEFVVEYAGELIEQTTAEERENKYALDVSKGCYMYYFKANGKHYCIDATVETGRLGRLVNHSRVSPNLQTKVVMVGKQPRLILVAKRDIEPDTELLYDYGDRSKESLAAHPWLAK